jgi:hypothetical protein
MGRRRGRHWQPQMPALRWPELVKGFELDAEEVDSARQLDALKRLFALKMDRSLTGEPSPVYVPVSEAGRARLQPFVAQMKNCAADAYGPMAGAYGKAGGHALRLALVLEFLWWAIAPRDADGAVEISERAMSAAIELVQNYFIPMARRALAEASIPPDDQKAMVLARYLQSHGLTFFNASIERSKVGGILRASKAMIAACHALCHAGLIRPRLQRSGPSVGRQRLDFEVNPAVAKAAVQSDRPASEAI